MTNSSNGAFDLTYEVIRIHVEDYVVLATLSADSDWESDASYENAKYTRERTTALHGSERLYRYTEIATGKITRYAAQQVRA